MSIYNVPAVLPGESVIGHAIRTAAINLATTRNAGRELFGMTGVYLPCIVPRNLPHYLQKVSPAFATVDQIIAEHTIFPAIAPFLSTDDRTSILTTMTTREGSGLGAYMRFARRCPAAMTWCLACVHDDVAEFGVAYWHREHQLPRVCYCAKHMRPLETTCGHCKYSFKGSTVYFLPGPICPCGGRTRTVFQAKKYPFTPEFLLAMSALSADLLNTPLSAEVSSEDIGRAFYARANAVALLAGNRFSATCLRRLIEPVATDADEAIRDLVGKEPALSRIAKCLRRRQSMNSYATNILLAALLFDSEQNFRVAVHESMTHVQPKVVRRTERPEEALVPSVSFERIDSARRKLQAHVEQNPGLTRTELKRAVPYCVNLLRQYDKAWYEALLPSRKNLALLHSGKKAAEHLQREAMDVALAERIALRYEMLVAQTSRPVRIEKQLLLKGEVTASMIRKTPESYPRTVAALETYVESRHDFLIRKASWFLLNPTAIPKSPRYTLIGSVCAHTRLPREVVEALAWKLNVV